MCNIWLSVTFKMGKYRLIIIKCLLMDCQVFTGNFVLYYKPMVLLKMLCLFYQVGPYWYKSDNRLTLCVSCTIRCCARQFYKDIYKQQSGTMRVCTQWKVGLDKQLILMMAQDISLRLVSLSWREIFSEGVTVVLNNLQGILSHGAYKQRL